MSAEAQTLPNILMELGDIHSFDKMNSGFIFNNLKNYKKSDNIIQDKSFREQIRKMSEIDTFAKLELITYPSIVGVGCSCIGLGLYGLLNGSLEGLSFLLPGIVVYEEGLHELFKAIRDYDVKRKIKSFYNRKKINDSSLEETFSVEKDNIPNYFANPIHQV